MTTPGMTEPAIRTLMLPRDTNERGTIFGGVILAHLDLAAAVAARHVNPRRKFVTVALKEVVFHEPVFVGDLISFYSHVIRTGRTSITIHVDVYADRGADPSTRVEVTEAEVVFVAVDDQGRPTPVHDDATDDE